MTIELTTKDIKKLTAAQVRPMVKETICNLESEIERLRLELDQTRRQVSALTELADQDPLVNVMNRRAFIREMYRIQATVERHHIAASFVYIDIDNLKTINNNHGQAAGDAVLQYVGEKLTTQIRPTDTVARLGGDEFGMILSHIPRENAEAKMANFSQELSDTPMLWRNCALSISLSYHIFCISPRIDTLETLETACSTIHQKKYGQL